MMETTKQPIGAEKMAEVNRADGELRKLVREEFEPYAGVYRINDFGDYVAEADFDDFWASRPAWHRMAWMLADNGQYSSEDVADMSVAEIESAYDDPDFEPEFAFYTEWEG